MYLFSFLTSSLVSSSSRDSIFYHFSAKCLEYIILLLIIPTPIQFLHHYPYPHIPLSSHLMAKDKGKAGCEQAGSTCCASVFLFLQFFPPLWPFACIYSAVHLSKQGGDLQKKSGHVQCTSDTNMNRNWEIENYVKEFRKLRDKLSWVIYPSQCQETPEG